MLLRRAMQSSKILFKNQITQQFQRKNGLKLKTNTKNTQMKHENKLLETHTHTHTQRKKGKEFQVLKFLPSKLSTDAEQRWNFNVMQESNMMMNIKPVLHYQDKWNLHFSEHLNYYFFHLKGGRTTCHLLALSKDDFASMFHSLLVQPWNCQSKQKSET